MEDRIVAFDVETPNSDNDRICSIGITVIDGNSITSSEEYLVDPDTYFSNSNISIHHITRVKVANAPRFDVLWTKISSLFTRNLVVAHNASFDLRVLLKTLTYYNIEIPVFNYVCTYKLSKEFLPEYGPFGLDALCKKFDIDLIHHNAASDSKACAEILLLLIKDFSLKLDEHIAKFGTISKANSLTSKSNQHSLGEIRERAKTSTGQKNVNFFGRNFVFTGELSQLTRQEAYTLVISGGGNVNSSVTKNVDVLVNADTVPTAKLKAALDLQEKGHHIKIITGEQFMEMCNNPGVDQFEYMDESTENELVDETTEYKLKDEIEKIKNLAADMISEHELFDTDISVIENMDHSISVMIRTNLAMRLKLTGKKPYILISPKYTGIADKFQLKNGAYNIQCKVLIDVIPINYITLEFIKAITEKCILDYSEDSFGCCSKYVKCSDSKKCLHADKLYSNSCQYKKNLLAGRIFYGVNKI